MFQLALLLQLLLYLLFPEGCDFDTASADCIWVLPTL